MTATAIGICDCDCDCDCDFCDFATDKGASLEGGAQSTQLSGPLLASQLLLRGFCWAKKQDRGPFLCRQRVWTEQGEWAISNRG